MNFRTFLSFMFYFSFFLHCLAGVEPMLQTDQKNRPQEPKPPFPYVVEEVSYGNSEIVLSGTLTLPLTPGPFPALILIHGSSPLDRDETLLGHKPFLVLADHFTRQGIAVLRFDKRGVGKSTGIFDTATIEDFCDDVAEGVEYLKSRPEIIRNQIGLVGHSEGGIVAPMLAAKSNDVAFIVLMAGTGVSGEEILCEQGRLLHHLNGVDEEMIAIDIEVRKIFTGIVKKETNRDAAKNQIHDVLAQFLSGLTENQKTWVKAHSIVNEEFIKRFNSPWGYFYFSYEPSTALRHLTKPILVLNGERDLVVSSKQNFPFIDEALKKAGNKDYTIIELPKLNHGFQTCQIGSWEEYEQTEETIAPSALTIMTDWIVERTAKNDQVEFDMTDLKSLKNLNALLLHFQINTDNWIKSVSDLFDEIKRGDCRLSIENGKLHRYVEGVAIKCFYINSQGERFQLIEEKQIFKNGQVCERRHPFVAEKLQFNESPLQGALRGLAEELQISGPDVHLIALPQENKSDTIDCPTYKGIQSSYNTSVFYCEIPHALYRSFYIEEQEDKQTFFSWIKISLIT